MTLSPVPREVTAVRQVTRKPRRNTGPSRKVRREVIERARGCCERCGVWAPDGQIHHRLPRGMGGTRDPLINDPGNLLFLGAGCHAYIESHREEAYKEGWLIRRSVPDYRNEQWWTR